MPELRGRPDQGRLQDVSLSKLRLAHVEDDGLAAVRAGGSAHTINRRTLGAIARFPQQNGTTVRSGGETWSGQKTAVRFWLERLRGRTSDRQRETRSPRALFR